MSDTPDLPPLSPEEEAEISKSVARIDGLIQRIERVPESSREMIRSATAVSLMIYALETAPCAGCEWQTILEMIKPTLVELGVCEAGPDDDEMPEPTSHARH